MTKTLGTSRKMLKALLLTVLVAAFAFPSVHFHDTETYSNDIQAEHTVKSRAEHLALNASAATFEHAQERIRGRAHALITIWAKHHQEHSHNNSDDEHNHAKETDFHFHLLDNLLKEIRSPDIHPSETILVDSFQITTKKTEYRVATTRWSAPIDIGFLPERRFILKMTKLSPPQITI